MSKSFITIILLVISICGASAKSSAALNSSLSTQQLLDSLDSSLGNRLPTQPKKSAASVR